MKLKFKVEEVEKKGCLTHSSVCTQLGIAREMEYGEKKPPGYYCIYNFPENCSIHGCPRLRPITDYKEWMLKA